MPAHIYRPNDPVFVKGTQAGYDIRTNKWRSSGGGVISRAEAVRVADADIGVMGKTFDMKSDQMSQAAERLERSIGGFNPFEYPDDSKAPQDPLPIPGPVLASYRLADYYYHTEGDIAAAVETPIMVAMRDPEVQSASKEVKDELERLYDVDGIDLSSLMSAMWIDMAVFSVAHPLECYDGPANAQKLRNVVMLPPPYVRMGSHLTGYQMMPFNGDVRLTKESLKATLPTALYQSFVNTFENKPIGMFNIPEGSLFSVRGLDHRWTLYPKPWLQGAFRALSTRLIYEEMRRAVYEGFRHQLWTFLLGDADHMPKPAMMTKLINDINGMTGERMGALAWWNAPLEIKVHAPNTDKIMESEEWWMLSIDIFRRLGMNMRVATGNTTTGRGGSQFDVDVNLMLEKFDFWRNGLLRWLRAFNLRYAKKTRPNDPKFLEEVRKANVVFSLSTIELGAQIKDMLIPLFTTGALSPQTLLERARFDFNTEIKNKRDLKASGDDELMMPPPTFAQTTVNPNSPEKTSATTQTGRPADKGQVDKSKVDTPKATDVKASDESDDKAELWVRLAQTYQDGNMAQAQFLVAQLAARDETILAAIQKIAPANVSVTLPPYPEMKAPEVNVEVQPAQVTVPVTVQAAESSVPILSPNITILPAPVNNAINVQPTPVAIINEAPTVNVTNEVQPTPVEVNVPIVPVTVQAELVTPPETVETEVVEYEGAGDDKRIKKIRRTTKRDK